MLILHKPELEALLDYRDLIPRMRQALVAQSRGECSTPMPMHLDVTPASGEVHMKASYREGGRYFALKTASTFPGNAARGLSTGSGMMMLFSAETGAPVALLEDEGLLTDVRTAAVAAMTAVELNRTDTILGILGTGIQARLEAALHAAVLDIREILVWGRRPEARQSCVEDIARMLPSADVRGVETPGGVAQRSRMIVTCTAAREPLLRAGDLLPGTHISAVGSDSPGKRELASDILQRAALILVDSIAQCERLGELQHAPHRKAHAVEIGSYAVSPAAFDPDGVTIADFTGLGVEDLYIAEYCYEKHQGSVNA